MGLRRERSAAGRALRPFHPMSTNPDLEDEVAAPRGWFPSTEPGRSSIMTDAPTTSLSSASVMRLSLTHGRYAALPPGPPQAPTLDQTPVDQGSRTARRIRCVVLVVQIIGVLPTSKTRTRHAHGQVRVPWPASRPAAAAAYQPPSRSRTVPALPPSRPSCTPPGCRRKTRSAAAVGPAVCPLLRESGCASRDRGSRPERHC